MKLLKRMCVLLLAVFLIAAIGLFGACSAAEGDKDNGGSTNQGGDTDEDNGTGDETGEEDADTDGEDDGETDGADDGDENEDVEITLTLSATEFSINAGEIKTVTAKVKGTDRQIRWMCSNSLVVSLDADKNGNCKVTGVGGGTATVTAYVADVKATAEFTVIEKEITAEYDLKVDGDLSDWEEAGLSENVLSVQGVQSSDSHKSATFYGVLDRNGLHLAVEAYHDVYENSYADFGKWWYNTQFEFFVGLNDHTHYFVYACADSESEYKLGRGSSNTDVFNAVMITEETGEETQANYRTIVEVFVPINQLPAVQNASLRVGIAWKTPGDMLLGGEAGSAENEPSEYWVPKGCYSNNLDKPYVTENGIYLPDEYEQGNV